jgi:hypothetical protein
MNVKLIDDHTGKKYTGNVIGVWINEKRKGIGLAVGRLHSINKLYIDENGDMHLSSESIGPAALPEDIERGEVSSIFGPWVLKRMPVEKIYELVKDNQAEQSA